MPLPYRYRRNYILDSERFLEAPRDMMDVTTYDGLGIRDQLPSGPLFIVFDPDVTMFIPLVDGHPEEWGKSVLDEYPQRQRRRDYDALVMAPMGGTGYWSEDCCGRLGQASGGRRVAFGQAGSSLGRSYRFRKEGK